MSEVNNIDSINSVLSVMSDPNDGGISVDLQAIQDFFDKLNELVRQNPNDGSLKDAFSRFSIQVENMRQVLLDAQAKGQTLLTKAQVDQIRDYSMNIIRDPNHLAVDLILDTASWFDNLVRHTNGFWP